MEGLRAECFGKDIGEADRMAAMVADETFGVTACLLIAPKGDLGIFQ